MPDVVSFVLSSFVSVILFVVGFILGGRQAKSTVTNVSHKISEKVLEAMKINERGDIQNTEYSRVTGNFEFSNPNSTTS